MGKGMSTTKKHSTTAREKLRSKAISKNLRTQNSRDNKVLKVLLLGTGESGKSTIFKQARVVFGQGYDQHELNSWKPRIYNNIFGQLKAVISFRRRAIIPLEDEAVEKCEDLVMSMRGTPPKFSSELVEGIKAIWKDRGIQKTWERRADFQVFDCLEYYLEEKNVDRILGANDYSPTFLDALQCRDKTTGIVTEKLRVENSPFELYDVGGQRTERRKWLGCFDNVTTVIFVTAINEYDQTLYEEEGVNRMEEALKVWGDIVNREHFLDIGFVLFLNKWDLFKEKVCRTPYKVAGVRNDDYFGKDPMEFEDGSLEQQEAIEECFNHVKQKFNAKVMAGKRSGIVDAYKTVGVDDNNMGHVFQTCKHQLLHATLADGGFIPLQI